MFHIHNIFFFKGQRALKHILPSTSAVLIGMMRVYKSTCVLNITLLCIVACVNFEDTDTLTNIIDCVGIPF